MFTVGQIVDVYDQDGNKADELSAEVMEVSDDTVLVKPKNNNVPDALAQLMGFDQIRIKHNLDGSAKDDGESDNEGWSIKPRQSDEQSA